jgi:hypothetical protein
MQAIRPSRRVIPVLLTVGVLTVFLATLSKHYTIDSWFLVEGVEAGNWRLLGNPRHAVQWSLAWLYYNGLQAVGWSGRAIDGAERAESLRCPFGMASP